MKIEDDIAAIKAALTAMSWQQDLMAAEITGLKKSIMVIAGLVPATEDEAAAAWETAAGLVGIANEQDGMPADISATELETIRQSVALLGSARRKQPPSVPDAP